MKTRLSLLGLMGVASISACSAGSTAIVDSDSTALTLATTTPATSLDFTTVGGAAIPAALMSNVYETLVRISPEGDIEPGLAESWEAEPTRYTFHLREAAFSNGEAFTAHTAAWSINAVKTEWTNGLKKQMDVVESATAVDEHTLVVELSRPSAGWLWSMGTAIGAMRTPTDAVGTGPFAVAGFSPGEYIALEARNDYWGTPAAEDITIRYFPDSLTAVNALRSGGVDAVWGVQNPELLDTLDDTIETAMGTTNGEVLLSMNNQKAPFDDPRVRRAVAYGIDREAANDILWEGRAQDTGGAPVPPTDPWFSGQDYYPFDPARARALMEDAGAVGTPLTLTVPSLPYAQTLSEFLYSQLEEMGFDVTLETAEFPAVWLSQVMGAKDYQMSLVAHVEPRDIPTIFGNPDYYIGYDSPQARKLLEQDDMAGAVDQIMEDMPALTLMNLPNIVLYREGLSGLQPNQITDAIELKGVR
ncbi:ABC transporter substrate-binding protein [Corynebacterium minutissimum]|uniref:Nickel ABC transport system, solute-binding protein n=1 Tax=Corynebacterium minutissimum TaxID=38301 RepID=A0A376D276_9CORY|nr:ABC transporter substrate-binding protein [Corynebacterium minutissimum]STC80171.1 nickel ABC transport system, solute-binding protein [Corynebacterium minutissimum]